MRPRLLLFVIATVIAATLPARAYIDIQPTLGRIINESQWIALVRVEKVSRAKRAIIYSKVTDLRGKWPGDGAAIRHQLTDGDPPRPPRELLDWAQPGRAAVIFAGRHGALVCTGQSWYRTAAPALDATDDKAWWRMTLDCPELALAYRGSARRLADAVRAMLAGQTVVITTVAHGAQGRGSFSDVVFNALQAGPPPAMQRLRASLQMPSTIYDINERSPSFVGLGALGDGDDQRLIEQAKSPDAWDRADAVDELSLFGSNAPAAAAKTIGDLLADPQPIVRLHAAAALLAIDGKRADARETLAKALVDASPDVRREAAHCLGRLGNGATFALPDLEKALTHEPDDDARLPIIETIGLIGSDAARCTSTVVARLDQPALRVYAAEALGRIGPTASNALPKLADLIKSDDAETQWTAAKAMVLIGGPGARPVVPFLVKRLEAAPRGRELYQLTWMLGLLGPVAKDATPALARARWRDNELASMAMWAVAPEEGFPWQLGYRADRDCDLWLFADYIQRMGPRADGAAVALVDALLDGTAGRVPSWGYHLLVARSAAALPRLTQAVNDPARRSRALFVLRQMGDAGRVALKRVD
jgi:HEAT repeats